MQTCKCLRCKAREAAVRIIQHVVEVNRDEDRPYVGPAWRIQRREGLPRLPVLKISLHKLGALVLTVAAVPVRTYRRARYRAASHLCRCRKWCVGLGPL